MSKQKREPRDDAMPLVVQDRGGTGTALAPTLAPAPMSEVAAAFGGESQTAVDRPSKIPIVKIDHKSECFILPSGETVEVVEGYPVYYFQTRRFYAKPPSPGAKGSPPDCWSPDLVTPSADALNKQNATCEGCKNNEWKSGKDGKSKACGTYTWLFLVNPNQFGDPPIGVMVVPPSSIRVLLGSKFEGGYIQQCASRHRFYQIVWSKFALDRAGDIHCVLKPEMGPPAPDVATAKQLAQLRDRFREAMDGMRGLTPQATADHE